MANRVGQGLNRSKRVLLVGARIAALAGPVAIGLVHASAISAQTSIPAVGDAPKTPIPSEAQAVTSVRPNFEVASVKRSPVGSQTWVQATSGRFAAQNVTLQMLVSRAYGVEDSQMFGGPNWFDSERYDVAATHESGTASPRTVALMLQALLEDRFRLRVHRETRDQPAYVLTVATSGLKVPKSNCVVRDPIAALKAGQKQSDICGFGGFGANSLRVTGISMPLLASMLESHLKRPVIDETRVNGQFDIALRWTPDDITPGASVDLDAPSIFTAVQEQLGLRLTSARRPSEVLIIDSAERPTEN